MTWHPNVISMVNMATTTSILHERRKCNYAYATGKSSPPFYFHPFCYLCKWANLSMGELQSNYQIIPLLTHLYRGQLKTGQNFSEYNRAKINWGDNKAVYLYL